MNRLEQKYKEVVTPSLMEKFGCKSVMEVPHTDKIVISMGIGEAISNPRALDEAVTELAQIIGQAPVITRAKRSIANFKLRERMPIGCEATLRRGKMYDFMSKLMNISLPRIRDFRDVGATSFGGRGDYTLDAEEQLVFPEVDYDKINKVHGMDIVIVMTANMSEEAKALSEEMGIPFKK